MGLRVKAASSGVPLLRYEDCRVSVCFDELKRFRQKVQVTAVLRFGVWVMCAVGLCG